MKSFKGIIFAMISSGTFGLIPLFALPLMNEHGMGNANILFYRFLFSTIIMGGICLIKGDNLKISKQHFLSISGLGVLYALTALFLIYSYHYIPSGVATTIHFLYPISVSLIMIVFFKEPKSKAIIVAALLSLIGVALMCWKGDSTISMFGVGLASITILTYGVYIVGLNQSSAGKLPAEVLTFYVLLAGAVIFLAYALSVEGVKPIPSLAAGTNLLMLALLATVISDLTLILAVKYAGSTMTSILGSMEPVVAVMVGVLVFHELFNTNMFFGLFLIILSVVLVILADARKQRIEKRKLQQKSVRNDLQED